MRELNEAAKKAMALFGANGSVPITGNWVKWYHKGIPDEPTQERLFKRQQALRQGHCFNCTALSGCYFIDGDKTCPAYPQHPNCDCEKQSKSPLKIEAICEIEKFASYILKNGLWQTNTDIEYIKDEFARQGKEKYIAGNYTLAELNKHGQQINIVISIQRTKQGIKSTWLVQPNGLITCIMVYGDVNKSIGNATDTVNPDSSGSTENQQDILDYIPYPSTKLHKFKKGDYVKLIRDKDEYANYGVKKGMVGYVISEYSQDNRWLIAFSKEGTYAEVWVYENDLELV